MDPRVFFPLGPPPVAPPPLDRSLEVRIKKLAEFAARNGPSFIEEVRTKQFGNPEYAFLHGGDGSSYFSWVLHNELLSHHHPAAPPTIGHNASAALPPQVRSGWAQVLSLLNGSKESITTSQAWFMACVPYAAGTVEMLVASADSAAATGNYTAALHYLWLVNDILFKAKSTRKQSHSADSDSIAVAFKPHLGYLLRRVYLAAGSDIEKQQAVAKVAHIWSERGVYPSNEVELMVMEMMGINAAPKSAGQPPPPPPPPQFQAPPPPPQPMPLPAHHLHGIAMHPRPAYPAPPPGVIAAHPMQHQQFGVGGGGQPWRPPPPSAPPPPAPEPEEPPFDPFSFPPGLIPRLVEDNIRIEIPYSPLKPSCISNSKVPPPPSLDDPYMKARVDKFYAQLDGYKIGLDFSDIEGETALLRSNNNNKVDASAINSGGRSGRGGGVDDGSGGFRAQDGGRGLGYGAPGGSIGDADNGVNNDDVFSSYRAMRSQGYHSGIGTRSIKSSRK